MKRLVNILLIISVLFVILSCSSTKKTATKKGQTKTTSSIKGEASVLNKYAKIMSVDINKLNPKLYYFIDSWMGVPYLMGGTSKSGVDCSGFVGLVYKHFGGNLPRTTKELAKATDGKKSFSKLKEGDLVFLNYAKKNSHVGIYLHNGWFVHASSSRGVIISDLNETHYKSRFNIGGTPKSGGL